MPGDQVGRSSKEFVAAEAGSVLQRRQRAAAFLRPEIVPAPGVVARQIDHSAPLIARWVTVNIGKAQFAVLDAAIGKNFWRPASGAACQCCGERVEVILGLV